MATTLLFLSGCSQDTEGEIKRLAMPVASTKEAPLIHDLWMWSWLAAMVTGVVVWGLIIYASIRYRRRSETEIPVQTRYNLPIEIFYTIAPVMMVIVFFYFTVDTQNKVLHTSANPDQTVTVVGQQWAWTFNYNLDYDKDKKAYEPDGSGEVVYEGGTPADRATLWLVKDQSVTINLESPDVVHSFWVPRFLAKRDMIPEVDNAIDVTPTTLGRFDGRCAEYCALDHWRMAFTLEVVEPEDLDAAIEAAADAANGARP